MLYSCPLRLFHPHPQPHPGQTLEYIEEALHNDSPVAFGLHPNVEISFRLREAVAFCSQLVLLQPRRVANEGGARPEDRAKQVYVVLCRDNCPLPCTHQPHAYYQVLDNILERLPEQFAMDDLRARLDEPTPYAMVAIQECERMNVLLAEMRRSLLELDLGLRGDLTMSEAMDKLVQALADDAVPGCWSVLAYPSLRSLGLWFADVLQVCVCGCAMWKAYGADGTQIDNTHVHHTTLQRVAQLIEWTADFQVPKSLWLPGLFNPQAFLTAVMQTTARKYDWPLDKTVGCVCYFPCS